MSIRFRADRKKYEVSFQVGSERRRRLFERKSQAEAFEMQVKLKAQGLVPNFEPIAIGEALVKYHNEVSIGKERDTFVNEKRWLRIAHLFLSELGLEYAHEIRLDHLEAFQKWLMQDHVLEYLLPAGDSVTENFRALKPQTVNRWFSTFGHVFTKLRQWRRIPENPCEFLAKLPEPVVNRRRWTREAVLNVFRASPEWFRPVFRVMYYYGARPSSIERFTWNDADFENGTLTFDSKKGAQARQKFYDVPMIPPMRRVLCRLRAKWPLVGESLPVFRDDRGRRLTADRISKTASRVIKACGYDLDFYELKHTLANDLRKAGVALDQVAELFGHADARSTKRYSNNLPKEFMAENLQKVRGPSLRAIDSRKEA